MSPRERRRIAQRICPENERTARSGEESRRDRGIVAGIGEQVRRHPVGLFLDLTVEPPVAAELAEEALLDAGVRKPPAMLEHEVAELVREHHRQFVVGGLGGKPVIDLDHPAVRARIQSFRRADFDQRAAARGRCDRNRALLPAVDDRQRHRA